MTVKVKICGVTRAVDGVHAARAGADFIGLNFWPKSKRFVSLERAAEVADAIRATGAGVQIVGVFVDADAAAIAATLAHVDLDIVQLHGRETPVQVAEVAVASARPIWKAVAARATEELVQLDDWAALADAILLDTPTPDYGGSGKTFDWALATEARVRDPERRIVLAGGLSPENVASAVAAVAPWAVDVASGVESAPGEKDAAKVTAFVQAARQSR